MLFSFMCAFQQGWHRTFCHQRQNSKCGVPPCCLLLCCAPTWQQDMGTQQRRQWACMLWQVGGGCVAEVAAANRCRRWQAVHSSEAGSAAPHTCHKPAVLRLLPHLVSSMTWPCILVYILPKYMPFYKQHLDGELHCKIQRGADFEGQLCFGSHSVSKSAN